MIKNYTVEQKRPNVHYVNYDKVGSGWEGWALLISDVHFDSKNCNRKLLKKHLKKAKQRDALVFCFGDFFDAMLGKYDRRKNYDDVRPEDVTENYYGSVTDHGVEFMLDYTDNIVLFGRGNHETAVTRHAGIDILSNMVYKLNSEKKSNGHMIYTGGYGGWVRFNFMVHKTVGQSIRLKYFHGSGAGAPVTKGVIETARQAVYLPDADIVANGHNHKAYTIPIPRERLSRNGQIKTDVVWYVRIPGYSDGYGDGSQGYVVESGHGPAALGAVWVHFTVDAGRSMVEYNPIMEIKNK